MHNVIFIGYNYLVAIRINFPFCNAVLPCHIPMRERDKIYIPSSCLISNIFKYLLALRGTFYFLHNFCALLASFCEKFALDHVIWLVRNFLHCHLAICVSHYITLHLTHFKANLIGHELELSMGLKNYLFSYLISLLLTGFLKGWVAHLYRDILEGNRLVGRDINTVLPWVQVVNCTPLSSGK